MAAAWPLPAAANGYLALAGRPEARPCHRPGASPPAVPARPAGGHGHPWAGPQPVVRAACHGHARAPGPAGRGCRTSTTGWWPQPPRLQPGPSPRPCPGPLARLAVAVASGPRQAATWLPVGTRPRPAAAARRSRPLLARVEAGTTGQTTWARGAGRASLPLRHAAQPPRPAVWTGCAAPCVAASPGAPAPAMPGPLARLAVAGCPGGQPRGAPAAYWRPQLVAPYPPARPAGHPPWACPWGGRAAGGGYGRAT